MRIEIFDDSRDEPHDLDGSTFVNNSPMLARVKGVPVVESVTIKTAQGERRTLTESDFDGRVIVAVHDGRSIPRAYWLASPASVAQAGAELATVAS